jgi:hypothetical protein
MAASQSDSRFLERRLERTSLGRTAGRGTLASWSVHSSRILPRPVPAPAASQTDLAIPTVVPALESTPTDLRLGA